MPFFIDRIFRKVLCKTAWRALVLSVLFVSEGLAEAKPPSPYDLFNLRTACSGLGDKLLEKLPSRKGIEKTQSAHYNPKTNRCYVEAFFNSKDMAMPGFIFERVLYDGQSTELLARALLNDRDKISDGKSGYVKDPKHQKTTESNRGWDDANTYMDELLEEKK